MFRFLAANDKIKNFCYYFRFIKKSILCLVLMVVSGFGSGGGGGMVSDYTIYIIAIVIILG